MHSVLVSSIAYCMHFSSSAISGLYCISTDQLLPLIYLSPWSIPAAHTGPRFTLNLIKIFDGSFGGATLYENPLYQTPNAVSSSLQYYCHFCFVPKHRRVVKQLASQKYKLKVKHSKERKERRKDEQTGLPVDPLADVFDTRSN